MTGFNRVDRVSDEIKRMIGTLIEREIRDPRVGFVTVTDVKVARDYSVATVYVTVGENEDSEKAVAGLRAAAGYIRKRLGETMRLRVTPELRFIYDSSVDRGFRMDALLKQIAEERDDNG